MAAGSHWVKIDRALEHVETLDTSVKCWLDSDAYTIRKEVEDQGANTRTAFVVRIPDPLPTPWAAYVGDAAHNLRSALDHLAFALNAKGYADANQGALLPDREAGRSEFPIFGDEDSAGNPGKGPTLFTGAARRRLAHVSSDALSIIEGIQPYKRGQEFREDPLWLIHELDRIDKHRQLVLTGAAVPRMQIGDLHFEMVIEAAIGRVGPAKHGDELTHWVVPKGQEPKEDMAFTRGVAFGEGTPVQGQPLIQTLRDLRDYMRFKIAFRLDPLL